MLTISQPLLTFLLNAAWQIALITAAAALGARLLRGTAARYRHLLWVTALICSCGLPALTSWWTLREAFGAPRPSPHFELGFVPATTSGPAGATAPQRTLPAGRDIPVDGTLAVLAIGFYTLLLAHRGGKLLKAWLGARAIVESAYAVDLPIGVRKVIDECGAALGIDRARILCSASISVPITVGVRAPLVILPEGLLREPETAVLTSAIGHELAHIRRRDYLLNLFYELMALPLVFHPATALMRRRISETRELGCDELVTDRLLDPAQYARSLVKLAGAAIKVGRPAATIAVGIADADILEERVMTILNRPNTSRRRRNVLLALAALVFIVPCAAAAPYALRIGITAAHPPGLTAAPQDDKLREIKLDAEKHAREENELRSIEEKLKRRVAELRAFQEKRGNSLTSEEEVKLKEEWKLLEHQMTELRLMRLAPVEVEEMDGAKLAQAAQIPMYQAIQIALSQQIGTVLDCRLRGHRQDNQDNVFYDVRILSNEGGESKISRYVINAIDGRILKSDKR